LRQILDLGQDAAGAAKDFGPGAGQADAARQAFDQPGVQRRFQLADLQGQRRLADMDLVGGKAELPGLGQGNEVAQLFQRGGHDCGIRRSYRKGQNLLFFIIPNCGKTAARRNQRPARRDRHHPRPDRGNGG
jgi:hypothetical protein